MSDKHASEEDLVMLYYREPLTGSLPAVQDARKLRAGAPPSTPAWSHAAELRAHLEVCPACQSAYRNLVRVLDACQEEPAPEPHPAFESRMWNRLEPQLHPLPSRWRPFPFWRTRWFAPVAVAAMLIVAFFAGRFTRTPRVEPPVLAITADGRERVLVMALGEHLERSQMVLMELANAPDRDAGDPLGRERARDLISENRLYRQTAAEAGDAAVTQLLDQLERVLLDITHGADAEEIKTRIDSESLLFKLRVLGDSLKRNNLPPASSSQETL